MRPVITHVLLATDFSRCADQAQDAAFFLAGEWKAKLTVLHVLEFQPGMDPDLPVNRQYLDAQQREADGQLKTLTDAAFRRGLLAQTRLATGIPSAAICRAAEETGADLIVLGTQGRTGLAHVLLGSTAERVVATAGCPVMVERAETEPALPGAPTGMRIGHLLVPVDFSDASLEALEYAVQIAGHSAASITLLHVLEPVSYGLDFTLMPAAHGPAAREQMARRLDELAAPLQRQGLAVYSLVQSGRPADAIVAWAAGHRPDLVLMGTHGRRGLSHLASGSVAEAVLRRACCPVLTVKSPKFRPAGKSLE